MRVTKGAAIFVGLFYILLWVLAVNGVSSLIPLLVVPAVLALLVAFGVWLNRYMGITPRRQHFEDRVAAAASDAADDTDPGAASDAPRDVRAPDQSGDAAS